MFKILLIRRDVPVERETLNEVASAGVMTSSGLPVVSASAGLLPAPFFGQTVNFSVPITSANHCRCCSSLQYTMFSGDLPSRMSDMNAHTRGPQRFEPAGCLWTIENRTRTSLMGGYSVS